MSLKKGFVMTLLFKPYMNNLKQNKLTNRAKHSHNYSICCQQLFKFYGVNPLVPIIQDALSLSGSADGPHL